MFISNNLDLEDNLYNSLNSCHNGKIFSFPEEYENGNNPCFNYEDNPFNYIYDRKNLDDMCGVNCALSSFKFQPNYDAQTPMIVDLVIRKEKLKLEAMEDFSQSNLESWHSAKVKVTLFRHILELINKKLKNSKNQFLKNLKLQKIHNSFLISFNKEKNLELFELTLKEILADDIIPKCLTTVKSKNRRIIEKILQENDEEINVILNAQFGEFLDLYNIKYENILFK